jgi:hypothetical protein
MATALAEKAAPEWSGESQPMRCRGPVFLSDYEDDFLNENTASLFAFIVGAAICGTVLFALVSAVRNVIVGAE